ncbi:glutaredoxin family protein [Desulfohalobium retbaense]|uniref:Glutaredoxin n=1 Tax=Desulfohalobium retbaense (strain ATCC 49708 / DSM 5692 / JCM 16813 / HR100) TaxID=485915 RepID=C8X2P6_DESRD|nr:glutaredoxin family protein [Desulfohalobium retbaense]ACV68693.1 glutaredoxin [Desulfohalobium retbaense DSM 5692]
MADITLYALSTCVHCKHTKEFLDECNVNYDCIYVDRLSGDERNDTIREIKKLNPNLSFPTLVIGDTIIVGYKKEDIEQALENHS